VTGSHIRGAEVAGSKVITITREQIDASGYGCVEDVLATRTSTAPMQRLANRGSSTTIMER
jgi:hypothetical protein